MTDDEGPQEHIRNALGVLIAGDVEIRSAGKVYCYTELEIERVKRRLWRAVEQLEKNHERG